MFEEELSSFQCLRSVLIASERPLPFQAQLLETSVIAVVESRKSTWLHLPSGKEQGRGGALIIGHLPAPHPSCLHGNTPTIPLPVIRSMDGI